MPPDSDDDTLPCPYPHRRFGMSPPGTHRASDSISNASVPLGPHLCYQFKDSLFACTLSYKAFQEVIQLFVVNENRKRNIDGVPHSYHEHWDPSPPLPILYDPDHRPLIDPKVCMIYVGQEREPFPDDIADMFMVSDRIPFPTERISPADVEAFGYLDKNESTWYCRLCPVARYTLGYIKQDPGVMTMSSKNHPVHLDYKCSNMVNPKPIIVVEHIVGRIRWCQKCCLMKGALYGIRGGRVRSFPKGGPK